MFKFFLFFLLFEDLFPLFFEHCVVLFSEEWVSQHIVIDKVVVLEDTFEDKA